MQNPYDIISDDQGYTFTTDYKISYRVVFDDINSMFHEYPTIKGRVFSFSFYKEKSDSNERRLDDKIRITLAHIINDFFKKEQNLIVFVCDSSDKRDKCRKKLFDKWFDKFNTGDLEKYDGLVKGEEDEIQNSIILKSDLKDKKHVLEVFESLNAEFSSYK